jgi:ribosomal protein S18 acetylase RimI-like enzyme
MSIEGHFRHWGAIDVDRGLSPDSLAVEYRLLVEADYDALAQLWWESWRSTGLTVAQGTTVELLRRRIDDEVSGDWEVTVATVGERLVGFLALKTRPAILDQLFIAPNVQRRGIGQRLLSLAKRKMPQGFSLRTAATNYAACHFYESAGLTRAGTATHPTLGHTIAIYRWN